MTFLHPGPQQDKNSFKRKTMSKFTTAILVLFLALTSVCASAADLAQKTHITKNVYEYDYLVTTGSGKYSQVGIHRITQVDHGKPIQSSIAVFLLHGDAWGFQAAFMGGIAENSLPVYLANQGVDVWGIDLAWTLIPESETDFSFMKDWGIGHDVHDIEGGIRFARKTRKDGGNDGGPLTLLGWSRGGWLSYALLNQESQKPVAERQVKAFISADNMYKTDSQEGQQIECSYEAYEKQQVQNGVYQEDLTSVQNWGLYAIHDPNGVSVILGAPYTNLQASLVFGAAGFQFGGQFPQYFHFVAGDFPQGSTSAPNGLKYTNVALLNSFEIGSGFYEPYEMLAETDGISCGDVDLPFDKHLKDITVPVHYVGAGGGYGSIGLYTLTLLGSTDVTNHIVSFYPADQAWEDFAHVDLFNANDASKWVWNDIWSWLKTH
jgi:hypothetical protein